MTDREIGQALSLLGDVLGDLEAGRIDQSSAAEFAGW
jgi:hypothetical protein